MLTKELYFSSSSAFSQYFYMQNRIQAKDSGGRIESFNLME